MYVCECLGWFPSVNEFQPDLVVGLAPGRTEPMAQPEQVGFQRGLPGELGRPLEFERSLIPGDLSLALV